MIKKYEIITVEDHKRIKALRSFSVQGRYVNAGDVGGIVYDENTLSQGGNAWIFSGNLNYPSIRVSGDSIVDTNGYEGAVTRPRPFVNIAGTSALIGAHEFVTGGTSAAKVLAVGDVEQGNVTAVAGSKYEESKVPDANVIRLKSLIYMGGVSVDVTLAGEGYEMRVLRYDAEKKMVSESGYGNHASTEGAYYIGISIRKAPAAGTVPADITAATVPADTTAATVPADITAAKVTIPSTAPESTINIKDSRIEFDYTSPMTVATEVNAANTPYTDVFKSVIDGSNISISKTGDRAFVANILADVIKCNVEWQLVSANSLLIGNFYNIGRLVNDGSYSFAVSYVTKDKINARDCYTFTQSGQVIPEDVLSTLPVSFPFKFIRCNVEHGLFYHNPVNRNVYTDIDFEKALTDLSEPLANDDLILASGEKQGMYRVVSKNTLAMGPLVEDIHSVKNLDLTAIGDDTLSVEIYKDAYLEGAFTLESPQVYGGSFGHDRSTDLKPHMAAVRGAFNTQEVGQIITGTVEDKNTMIIAAPVRVNGIHGMEIDGLTGSGVTATLAFTDIRGKIAAVGAHSNDVSKPTEYGAKFHQAYITFSKEGSPVTEDDLKGIVIRTFNGCKVVNTKETAIVVKGSVRVEGNAAVYDSSISGSGYFGGNSVTENANVNGSMLIKDDAVFAPVAEADKSDSCICLEDRARFLATSRADANTVIMKGDTVFSGHKTSATVVLIMRDNARCEGSISGSGALTMNGDSHISAGSLSANGDITVTGDYKQTAARAFYGKRVISNESEPTYDNNVKTQYDF